MTQASLHPVTLTVDQAAILLYAQVTDDFNPIHVDPDFAATTPLGQVIAHGMLSANLIIQSIALSFGTARASRSTLDIRFARPANLLPPHRVGENVGPGMEEPAVAEHLPAARRPPTVRCG